nr:uncharacterized protein LOC100176336 [Ciona intestinalis]|eukprot:XP_002123599.4 uncharacterized protein LOC100176336 [Ciona intestinalis]
MNELTLSDNQDTMRGTSDHGSLTNMSEAEILEQMISRICKRNANIITEMVIFTVAIVLGLFANAAVGFVCGTRTEPENRSANRSKWMILQIVVANLVYLIFALIHTITELIGHWTLGATMCKLFRMAIDASCFVVACSLIIANVDLLFMKLGSAFQPPKFFSCSGKLHRRLVSLAVWVICICVSIPAFMYSNLGMCKDCVVVYPITKDEMCVMVGLDEEACNREKSLFDLSEINNPSQEYDYFIPEYADPGKDSLLTPWEGNDYGAEGPTFINETGGVVNIGQPTSCKADAARSYRTSLYLKFLFHFLLPVILMILPFVASFMANESQQPTRESRTWSITINVTNILFIVCWLPVFAIEMARVNTIPASPSFCDGLLLYSRFSITFNPVLFPFLYMAVTPNFSYHLFTSAASVAYRLAERVTPSNDINLRKQTTKQPEANEIERQTLVGQGPALPATKIA